MPRGARCKTGARHKAGDQLTPHTARTSGLFYDHTMTRKKDTALAQPVNADKWERQRNAERITVQDRKTVPHLNSTMGGRYEGKELQYRGRQ